MTSKEPTDLETLIAYAEGYATFAMENIGRVPPTMLALTPEGLLHFMPENLADERAKDNFANVGRLICSAYGATSLVMIMESWVTLAKPGEPLDMTTPPSESFDRREFVVLMGETRGRNAQRFLPIVRTGAGEFFGFGDSDLPQFDGLEGRFATMLPPEDPPSETRAMARALLASMGVTRDALRSQFGNN